MSERCDSDVTLRNDQHRFVRCELEAGHKGEHRGEDVTWTDWQTVDDEEAG